MCVCVRGVCVYVYVCGEGVYFQRRPGARAAPSGEKARQTGKWLDGMIRICTAVKRVNIVRVYTACAPGRKEYNAKK